jgi:hypothetical protein
MLLGLGGQRDRAGQAARIGDRAPDQLAHRFGVQGLQREQDAAGQQR